jgi:hypothetical protein
VQELVHLLLVLDHGEAGLRVGEDELHLLLDGVLVERHRHAAQRLGGQHRPVERGAIVADHGGRSPRAKPSAARPSAMSRDSAKVLLQV